jgi:hypothetical protein
MLTRLRISLILMAASLLVGLIWVASGFPVSPVQAAPPGKIYQSTQAQASPSPLPQATLSPTPDLMDSRPVERNPFLIAGGVLIFLVIIFGIWRYSRPPEVEQ